MKLENKTEYRELVKVNLRRYFPKEMSKHVEKRVGTNSSKRLFQIQRFFKYEFADIEVYTNEEPAAVKNTKPKSFLFVMPNGDHVIINQRGLIVSIVPYKLLQDSKRNFTRCNCAHCAKIQ